MSTLTILILRPVLTRLSTPRLAEFDYFYNLALQLLNQFYPERSITLTARDPDYITPKIKAMLRRKNKLMRFGRVEEAGALAGRIGTEIALKICGRRFNS